MNYTEKVPDFLFSETHSLTYESMAYEFENRVILKEAVFCALRGAACPTGARKCKRACIGYRQERPATASPTVEPTQRRCSDCGKERANVTGNSARAVGMHPSLALGLVSTEEATRWSGRTNTVTLPYLWKNA